VSAFQTLLRPLERLETAMGEIYDTLATTFVADSEASGLFSRLALEERSHLSQIQFLRRLARTSRAELSLVKLHLEVVLDELARIEIARGAAHKLSLQEALALTCEFEQGAAETHGRQALAAARPELVELFANLARGDAQHQEALREFAARRGFPVPQRQP
jgi:rubrerythrin